MTSTGRSGSSRTAGAGIYPRIQVTRLPPVGDVTSISGLHSSSGKIILILLASVATTFR